MPSTRLPVQVEVSIVTALGNNRRYLPSNIPLTAREVMLGIKVPLDQWTDKELEQYIRECIKFGIPREQIGNVIHRSTTFVGSCMTKFGIKRPPKPPKPEPQPKRHKPSPPKRYA